MDRLKEKTDDLDDEVGRLKGDSSIDEVKGDLDDVKNGGKLFDKETWHLVRPQVLQKGNRSGPTKTG